MTESTDKKQAFDVQGFKKVLAELFKTFYPNGVAAINRNESLTEAGPRQLRSGVRLH